MTQPLAPIVAAQGPPMYWKDDGAPVIFLSMITIVSGSASGIHGSVCMIRSPALAVSSARLRWSRVVRARSRAAVIRGSSKSS